MLNTYGTTLVYGNLSYGTSVKGQDSGWSGANSDVFITKVSGVCQTSNGDAEHCGEDGGNGGTQGDPVRPREIQRLVLFDVWLHVRLKTEQQKCQEARHR